MFFIVAISTLIIVRNFVFSDAGIGWQLLKRSYTVRTIGRTSNVAFGIPAKRLNITIYPILGESFVRNVIDQTVFRIVSAVTILKTSVI